jgi:hypothetical protein
MHHLGGIHEEYGYTRMVNYSVIVINITRNKINYNGINITIYLWRRNNLILTEPQFKIRDLVKSENYSSAMTEQIRRFQSVSNQTSVLTNQLEFSLDHTDTNQD